MKQVEASALQNVHTASIVEFELNLHFASALQRFPYSPVFLSLHVQLIPLSLETGFRCLEKIQVSVYLTAKQDIFVL